MAVRMGSGGTRMTEPPVRREDGRCLMCRRPAHNIDAFCSAVCSRAYWGTQITGDPVDLDDDRSRVPRGGTQIERHK